MDIITTVAAMVQRANEFRAEGKRIALVPTMGALHRGHLSLLDIARRHSDTVIVSIFVNPTQFGPGEDYQRYPRPFNDDSLKARDAGAALLFAPPVEEMYPPAHRTMVQVSGITEKLCGSSRPGHFSGVTTVVHKLFAIITPHLAVFGAKDAQQVVVIKRMVTDLHCPTTILVCPIVRETDGLAISSRNVYLTPAERQAAPLIYRGLNDAGARFLSGERNAATLAAVVRTSITQSTLIIPEYVEVVATTSLEPLTTISSGALLAVACRMRESGTRLIDNTFLGASL